MLEIVFIIRGILNSWARLSTKTTKIGSPRIKSISQYHIPSSLSFCDLVSTCVACTSFDLIFDLELIYVLEFTFSGCHNTNWRFHNTNWWQTSDGKTKVISFNMVSKKIKIKWTLQSPTLHLHYSVLNVNLPRHEIPDHMTNSVPQHIVWIAGRRWSSSLCLLTGLHTPVTLHAKWRNLSWYKKYFKFENDEYVSSLKWLTLSTQLEYWQNQEGPRRALCKFAGAMCRSKVRFKVTRSKVMPLSERHCHKERTCQIWMPYLWE